MKSLPPLDAFHVLAACVRHGSFSRAAAELCVTPSAVSARIRGLEIQLGFRLFDRRGPKLTATSQALHLASAVAGAIDTVRSAVEDCHGGRTSLRVTCAPTFARWLLMHLDSYHAIATEDVVTLDATPTVLSSDRFDVAIRAGHGRWPGLSCERLISDCGTPMVSPNLWESRAPSIQRLLELPLLPDVRWTRWLTAAGAPEAKPRFSTTRFATYELDAAAAVRGLGVALLSTVLYGDLLRSGVLEAPFETEVDGPDAYWAAWKQGTPMPRFVRWLKSAVDASRAT